jgi:3-oxoacyl-(acyl-carrier-protein) synthase
MRRRRVKITGIGPVTPAGTGREEFWRGILEPVSRVRPFHKLGTEHGQFVAAYMDDFDVSKFVDPTKIPKGAARHSLLAVAAAVLALQDAGITQEEFVAATGAIVTGTSLMDFGAIVSSIDAVTRRGARAAHARTIFTTNVTGVQDAISQVLGASARAMAIQSACCSGMDAIGYAAELISNGEVDMAICGGTEAPLHRFPMLEFRLAGMTPFNSEMPERVARPFDLWRTTGVVSEGATMVVIEPEDSPRPGYSFISGYGFAHDGVDDLCGGIAVAAKQAMAAARVRPPQIEVINAWGPGHRQIDEAEYRAMTNVFPGGLAEIPTVSIKGSVGSALGAAPAIQIATAALGQRFGLVPPTVNWVQSDPGCPLNLTNRMRAIEHQVTLVNSHGIGGVNACMVLERC